jgi:flagellar hook assembly protein FlgD
LPATAAVTITIFDAAGRQVRDLAAGTHAPGAHALRWDGRDGDGRPSPAGLYFVRLRGAGEDRSARVIVLQL